MIVRTFALTTTAFASVGAPIQDYTGIELLPTSLTHAVRLRLDGEDYPLSFSSPLRKRFRQAQVAPVDAATPHTVTLALYEEGDAAPQPGGARAVRLWSPAAIANGTNDTFSGSAISTEARGYQWAHVILINGEDVQLAYEVRSLALGDNTGAAVVVHSQRGITHRTQGGRIGLWVRLAGAETLQVRTRRNETGAGDYALDVSAALFPSLPPSLSGFARDRYEIAQNTIANATTISLLYAPNVNFEALAVKIRNQDTADDATLLVQAISLSDARGDQSGDSAALTLSCPRNATTTGFVDLGETASSAADCYLVQIRGDGPGTVSRVTGTVVFRAAA